MTVTDRAAAKAHLLAVFTDETTQPEGFVAMRCTDHGRFVVWVWHSVPDCRVDCPAACAAERGCDACRVMGPLLTAPGTSGRSWRCECGQVWPLPEPALNFSW